MALNIIDGQIDAKCDGATCRRSYSTTMKTTGREEFVARLMDNGWLFINDKAYCPTCAKLAIEVIREATK